MSGAPRRTGGPAQGTATVGPPGTAPAAAGSTGAAPPLPAGPAPRGAAYPGPDQGTGRQPPAARAARTLARELAQLARDLARLQDAISEPAASGILPRDVRDALQSLDRATQTAEDAARALELAAPALRWSPAGPPSAEALSTRLQQYDLARALAAGRCREPQGSAPCAGDPHLFE